MSFKESNRDESTVQRGFVDFFQTRPDSNKLPLLRVIELNPQANSSLHASRRNANDFKKDQTKSQAEGPGFLGLSPKARGLILLNLVMLACSSTFVVLKDGQKNVDPFVFSSARFLLAAAAFSPYLGRAFQDPKVRFPGIEIGVWAAGGYLTQSVSLLTTDASRGAFLSAFTVVVVPLLEGTFGSNRIHKSHWIAAGMALVGVMLIEDSGSPPCWGDFWSFASAVLFGVQIFRTEHWSKRLGPQSFMPVISVSLVVIACLSLIGGFCTSPQSLISMLQRPFSDLPETIQLPWSEILYMAFIVTNFGLWAEVIALQHITSTEAAIVYTLEPVVGAGLAWLLLGESFGGFPGWTGAVLVTASQLVSFIFPS